MTNQMKAIEQMFALVLFIVLCAMTIALTFVNENLTSD